MEITRKLANQLKWSLEHLFPSWAHRRHRHHWERRWADPDFSPVFKADRPQKELVDAIDSGWFPKHHRIIDVGCGNGEASRWLADQGFDVLGLDYSAAAIKNCRQISAGQANAPTFEVADLCSENLRIEPAFSLIDRGCFHRNVERLHEVFARNIARATLKGGHFLLLASTFQDPRFVNCGSVRSEPQLREHVRKIFGKHFFIERAEPTVISAAEAQQAPAAIAFWMVRKPEGGGGVGRSVNGAKSGLEMTVRSSLTSLFDFARTVAKHLPAARCFLRETA